MQQLHPEQIINVLPLGATLAHFQLATYPYTNLVLSLPGLQDYVENPGACLGETVGRVAGRIGRFDGAGSEARSDGGNAREGVQVEIGNKSWMLPVTEKTDTHGNGNGDGGNCLHGGVEGWGKREWQDGGWTTRNVHSLDAGIQNDDHDETPTLTSRKSWLWRRTSPHLEEGFPGAVEARVWFTPWVGEYKGRPATVLDIEFEAEMVGEESEEEGLEETVVGMTGHSYFNLSPKSTSNSPQDSHPLALTPTLSSHTLTLRPTLHLPLTHTARPHGIISPLSPSNADPYQNPASGTAPPQIVPDVPADLSTDKVVLDNYFAIKDVAARPGDGEQAGDVEQDVDVGTRIGSDTRGRGLREMVILEYGVGNQGIGNTTAAATATAIASGPDPSRTPTQSPVPTPSPTPIHLHVLSTEPGLQIYTGDGLDIHVKHKPKRKPSTHEQDHHQDQKHNKGLNQDSLQGQDQQHNPDLNHEIKIKPRAGIALEPGRFSNAVNVPAWRGMVRLRRGERYGGRIRYVAYAGYAGYAAWAG